MTFVPSESYNRVPVGRTVVRGTPVIRQEKKLTTVAKVGMLMQIDGTDYKCKPQVGADNPVGWLAYEECPAAINRPNGITTQMQVGDIVGIVGGGGIEVVAYVSGSDQENVEIDEGDFLVPDGITAGVLKKCSSTTSVPPVAIAVESVLIIQQVPAEIVKLHVKSLI